MRRIFFFHPTGETRLSDLCGFWTGWNVLPPRKEILVARFSEDKNNKSPLAETCFMSLIVPVGHTTYESFRNSMDIAIQYGSKGFYFA